MKTDNFNLVLTKSAVALVALSAFVGMQASAQSELELISGASTVILNGTAGFASTNVSVGAWNANVTTGLGTSTYPLGLELNSVSETTTGTPNSLTIIWSDTGYTQTGAYNASIGGTLSPGLTATFSSYYGGALGSTTTLLTGPTSDSSSPFTNSVGGIIPTITSTPFTLTEQVVLTGGTAPDSQTSFSFNLTPVPEPSMISLLALGGASFVVRRFKNGKNQA